MKKILSIILIIIIIISTFNIKTYAYKLEYPMKLLNWAEPYRIYETSSKQNLIEKGESYCGALYTTGDVVEEDGNSYYNYNMEFISAAYDLSDYIFGNRAFYFYKNTESIDEVNTYSTALSHVIDCIQLIAADADSYHKNEDGSYTPQSEMNERVKGFYTHQEYNIWAVSVLAMLDNAVYTKNPNMKLDEYIDFLADARKILSQAKDLYNKRKLPSGISIADDCDEKLKYRVSEIDEYKNEYNNTSLVEKYKYGGQNQNTDFVEYGISNITEKELIRIIWKTKKANPNKGYSISHGISARPDQTYQQYMNYDKSQAILFMDAKFNFEKLSEQEKKTVKAEWDYLRTNGTHTSFYFEHAQNTERKFNSLATMTDEEIEALNVEEYEGNGNTIDDDEYNHDGDAGQYTDHVGDTVAEAQERIRRSLLTGYQIPTRTSATTNTTNLDVIIDSGTNFLNAGQDEKISANNIQNLSNSIYNILLAAGMIIAIIVGAIIAIKFMTGSVEEKADIKKLLIPYVVGCITVFGAFGIWKLVVTILAEM